MALELTDGREPVTAEAVSGAMAADAEAELSVPVMHLDRRIGTIECGPALDRRPASERQALLDLLAYEAALAAELAASRARIVTAQEAERRRVERDIHDGAQQELVAMIAKLRIARELAGRDQEAALATLEELQRDAQSALRGIRELAQGIHPSVLGDQGLVAAIEDRTARIPLQVCVIAEPATRASRFPNPIEGAAFFVVSEALANVLKHAGATRATVGISRQNGTLIVEVGDDGCGFDPGQPRGDGLTRLADRVAALGGRLSVRSSPGTGTVVTAVLPAGAQHDAG